MADERPLRFCGLCGGLDTDPRHTRLCAEGDDQSPSEELWEMTDLSGAPREAVEQFMNERILIHHHDCGAAAGCETCLVQVEEQGHRTGEELVEFLAEERANG